MMVKKAKRRVGRPPIQPGHSLMVQVGDSPERRTALRLYLTETREGFIHDLGRAEAELTTIQRVQVDGAISLLSLIRAMEEEAREQGVFRGRQLAPALMKSYITYRAELRRLLTALGISKKVGQDVVDAYTILNSPCEPEDEPDLPVDEPPEAQDSARDVLAAQTTPADAKDTDKPKPQPPAPPAPKPKPEPARQARPVDMPRHPDLDHIREFCGRKGCGSPVVVEVDEVLPDGRANLRIFCPICGEAEGFALSAADFRIWQELQRIRGESNER